MPVSLLSKLADAPVVFLDVETTGASAKYGDRVTEVALARYEGGRCVEAYAKLVNPQRRISPGVVALTGITPEMVADEPPFRTIAAEVAERMRDAVVVGHNVRFDLSFVGAELRRSGTELADVLRGGTVLDTVRIARKLYGRGGNGLQRLAARLDCRPTVAHRALADALTTAAVMERMLGHVGCWQCQVCDALSLQGGVIRHEAAAPDDALPVELEDALAEGRPVAMVYLDARNNRTQRVIRPLRLNRTPDDAVLVAYCSLRREQRTFKLSRVIELKRIEEHTEQEAGPL